MHLGSGAAGPALGYKSQTQEEEQGASGVCLTPRCSVRSTVPSICVTSAHLASPVFHPFVPLVEKLLEGHSAVSKQIPKRHPHGPLHITKP